ncbi:MAG: DNA polymerase III subunit gamma and tau [Demequina sp.]|nr:DNA polymerase III subunit gamma and tau [Demequina sp.]
MSTALYRRYRPDTFADIVGQEHVTAPLQQALRADRVAHAYLFSGPRGCGKTTSARILARCLNCVEGPTDTPCGKCDSCVELARGGSGSVDVVEIDAASHNGVDDARELRERAAFAPARDRYKIFILDEAHMVTTQGFNALLKLVEEPPPHVRFVFATTEPDKVIGTIRSRTHHYPFRLVPPGILTDYLAQLAGAEGVDVADGVLPLVVRAGGGSVRDSLSVLDQLIAGSDEKGVSYERAISLLGFTDATLLDDAIDAIAAADGASLFAVVARVVETGHEPRRFVEDLLERLRDLIVLAASGAAGAQALAAASEDQQERLADQARRLGLGRASRAGDLVNEALTGMIGATSPRLHLELLCARIIAADTAPVPSARPEAPGPERAAPTAEQPRPANDSHASGLAAARAAVNAAREESATQAIPTQANPQSPASTRDKAPEPAPPRTQPPTASVPQGTAATPAAKDSTVEPVRAPTGDVADGPADSELVRRRWPEVLGTLERRRVTWAMVSQSAQVASVEAGVLKVAFDNPAIASRFGAGAHAENLALAVRETLGLHVRVEPVVGPAEPATSTGAVASARAAASPASADEPPLPDNAPVDDEEISDDDHAAPAAQLSGADVIASMLGGTVVED